MHLAMDILRFLIRKPMKLIFIRHFKTTLPKIHTHKGVLIKTGYTIEIKFRSIRSGYPVVLRGVAGMCRHR